MSSLKKRIRLKRFDKNGVMALFDAARWLGRFSCAPSGNYFIFLWLSAVLFGVAFCFSVLELERGHHMVSAGLVLCRLDKSAGRLDACLRQPMACYGIFDMLL